MLRIITPTMKGLITGAIMVAIILLVFYTGQSADSPLQFAVYAIYAVGIVWTLFSHIKSDAYKGTFGDLFSQGFKCFIVVTLIMVIFYWIFSKMNPNLIEEAGEVLRTQLQEEKGKLPGDIDKEVQTFKDRYSMSLVSGAIFGYLFIGAVVTATCSFILNSMKK